MTAAKYTTAQLAVRYIGERERQGRIEKRAAREVRSVLADFAERVPEDPRQIRRRHVERWLERKITSLAPSTLRLRLSMLRGFCNWCASNRYMQVAPTLGVESPIVPEGMPKRLRPDEACAVARAARGDLRTMLCVSLMLQEGLRRKEIAELLIEDIDFGERSFLVRSKGGKGETVDALPMTSETWTILNRYLADARLQHGPLIRNRWRPSSGVTPETIADVVTRAMIDAGVKVKGDRNRTAHSCRHTAAHDMLTRTKNVRAVQKALRHKSVSSTEIYLRGHVTDLREIMEGRSYGIVVAVPDPHANQMRLFGGEN